MGVRGARRQTYITDGSERSTEWESEGKNKIRAEASPEIGAHLSSHPSYAGRGDKAPGCRTLLGTLGQSSPPQRALVNRLHYGPVSRLLSSCPALRHCLWRVRSPDLRQSRLGPSDGTGLRYYLLRGAEGSPLQNAWGIMGDQEAPATWRATHCFAGEITPDENGRQVICSTSFQYFIGGSYFV